MTLFSKQSLATFIKEAFIVKGMSEVHASIASDVLVFADLRGIDSHGIARLSGYLRLIDKGRINVHPKFEFESRKKTMLRMNADGAIGLVSAHLAMKEAIERTHEYGSAWVGIYNSNHFGVAAHHAVQGFEHNYIGFAMTNASPLVVPANGIERMLGTNPLCIAIPNKQEPHFILDMATSAAANGKLEIAQRSKKDIPIGWAIDHEGNATNNPSILSQNGALLPLGSDAEHGYHKGYGLASWVDIFSAVLPGAGFGPWAPPFVSFLEPKADAPGKGLGHFVGCWDLSGFDEIQAAQERMTLWINRFKESKATNNQRVMIPGEPEYITMQERNVNGIPLHETVVADLENIAKSLGISLK